jgi:hypothetical protein
MQFTVYKLRRNKNKRDVYVNQIINMFAGLGKGSGGGGIFQVLDKKSVINL